MKTLAFAVMALVLLALPVHANAATGCLIIISYPDGKTLHQDGDCTTRRSPASTFKIPLALMGFDSDILKDAHNPVLEYKPEYNGLSFQQKTTDPAIWEKDSIVWYSQQLTKKLGTEKFQHYVDQFNYGNRDLSGHPGKNDGLTQAWLFTSLAISPKEETDFIAKMLDRKLGVSPHAYDMTYAIMPEFAAGPWTVHGKTGSGHINDDQKKPQGWFVGWAENGARRIIFAKMILPDQAIEAAGPKARDLFLEELTGLLPN